MGICRFQRGPLDRFFSFPPYASLTINLQTFMTELTKEILEQALKGWLQTGSSGGRGPASHQRAIEELARMVQPVFEDIP